jgi:DNA primase
VLILKRRGIDQDIAAKIWLRFCTRGLGGCNQVPKASMEWQWSTAVKAGLAIPRPKGDGAYDRFRGRIMFPIRDFRGRVVAFGGRMVGPGEPKYLNSPETPIYSKGRLLYALDQARSGIEREDVVLIVEGYLDVLACHQFDFDFAVASLGTALTIEQLELLKRFTTMCLLPMMPIRLVRQLQYAGWIWPATAWMPSSCPGTAGR